MMVEYDFPDAWPSLLPSISDCLRSADQNVAIAGLQTLYQVFKNYECVCRSPTDAVGGSAPKRTCLIELGARLVVGTRARAEHRFKDSADPAILDGLVQTTFPTLLQLAHVCMGLASNEAGLAAKLVAKIFLSAVSVSTTAVEGARGVPWALMLNAAPSQRVGATRTYSCASPRPS